MCWLEIYSYSNKGATLNDWQTLIKEAKQFKTAAEGKDDGPSKFNTSIRYNLLAMSLEKSVMAILDFNRDLPDNHTFSDLLSAVLKYVTLSEKLVLEIKYLERMQSICSIYDYERKIPKEDSVKRLSKVVKTLFNIAGSHCNPVPLTELQSDV